jgi:hypothetical protein
MIRHGVHQVRSGDAAAEAAGNLADFDQVVGEQSEDVIRLDPRAVGIDEAEAVGVAVGG